VQVYLILGCWGELGRWGGGEWGSQHGLVGFQQRATGVECGERGECGE